MQALVPLDFDEQLGVSVFCPCDKTPSLLLSTASPQYPVLRGVTGHRRTLAFTWFTRTIQPSCIAGIPLSLQDYLWNLPFHRRVPLLNFGDPGWIQMLRWRVPREDI